MAKSPSIPEPTPQFRPLRPASPHKRRIGYLIGSLAWLVALVAIAVVVHQAQAVGLALSILAASFALGIVVSLAMRRGRLGEEERA